MTHDDPDREWTQAELRTYLEAHGWTEAHFRDLDLIPQGVKYVSFAPPTEADIARARQLIAEHPEWEARP
jgi:hypothetical protein